jgi:hypothetical protein
VDFRQDRAGIGPHRQNRGRQKSLQQSPAGSTGQTCLAVPPTPWFY